MSVLYPLKEFCSTTGRTQDAAQKTFAFCLLGLFEHTSFDLKHFSMISLIENDVPAHFATVPLKRILLHNQPHAGSQGKNHRKLLIRSIQIYFN